MVVMVSLFSLRDGVVISATQSRVVSTFISIIIYLNYFILGYCLEHYGLPGVRIDDRRQRHHYHLNLISIGCC